MATKTTKKATTKPRAKAKPKAKSVPFTNVRREIATTANVSPTDAGKAVRAHIRRNRDALIEEGWTALRDHEHGNRYPDMPATMVTKFVSGRVASLSKKAS